MRECELICQTYPLSKDLGFALWCSIYSQNSVSCHTIEQWRG